MKHFCKMRFAILLIFTVLLSGCFRSTPVDTAVDSAQNSVVALEKSLKPDCRTEGINEQIKAIKTSINEIKEHCMARVQVLQEQKLRWQILFFGALAVIGFAVFRKFRI